MPYETNQNPFDGVRDMNAPSDQPKIQTPGETGANSQDYKLAMKLYAQAKQVRKQYDQDWSKWERWYKGQQYDWKRPSYRAAAALNILRPTVQTILPILTDTSPSFDIMPQEPTDFQFAEIINELVDSWWQKRNMQVVITYSIHDSLIFPCGVMKCVWNDDLDGVGDIECTRIDPRNIYVDADATDFTDARYVIEEKWVAISELRMKFPEKRDLIQGGKTSTDPMKALEGNFYSGQVNLQSPIDQDLPIETTGNVQYNVSPTSGDMKLLKVLECWIQSDELVELQQEDKDGGPPKTMLRKKYPRGQVITVLPDSQVLLQVADNPYGDGRFPYVRFVDAVVPGKFWGEGEVSPLIETQKLINKVGSVITDWCSRMTNNVWILDDDSGVNPNQITNQVGLILMKRRGTQVSREAAPPLPPEVFNFYQLLMALADQQSGVHDVTQGRKPTGVTAASAIQEMQDAAQTRIRLKERNLQASLVQLGYMICSRMLQFYTNPRVVRITGQSEWPEFFEVYFSKTEYDSYIANHKHYEFAPATRQYTAVNDWTQLGPSKGEFDIQVQAGTSMPFMKQRRSQLAFNLYNANPAAIDQEALLKSVDFPDYQEVMRRMQMQTQGQGQPQPGMPSAGAPSALPTIAPGMETPGRMPTPAEQGIMAVH
jgi:hypothetical protein